MPLAATPPPSPKHPARQRTWLVCALLVIGTLALFSRALPYGFTNYDDPGYLTSNPHVQAGLHWPGVVWALTGRTDYWHPLTWLSHMLDWQLYSDNATRHRATSLLWHAANAVLVFLVTRRLTVGFWGSVVCAALFAWHPLRVESVVWLPERKDVMSGFFFLLTVWAYLVYGETRHKTGRPARGAYGGTLAAFIGALMCKPVMVAVPGVLLLLDAWPLRRAELTINATGLRQWGRLLAEKIPFLVLSVVIAIVTLRMQHAVGALSLQVPLAERLGNAVVSLVRYLGKIGWPTDLAVIYPHPGAWPADVVIAGGVIVAAITLAAWWRRQRQPAWLVGWGWFVVMLVPSIGLVQAGVQAMADRYTYFPVIGLLLPVVLAWEAWVMRPASRRVAVAVAAIVLVACGVRTWQQQAVWRDPLTLFAHALASTNDNYVAHGYYALTLLTAERTAEAEPHALRAVELRPDFALAHDTLAVLRLQQGRFDEAMAGYRRVLELCPRSAPTLSDLGHLLLRRGEIDEAEAQFRASVAANPEFPLGFAGLARVAAARGDVAGAIAHYERAIALQPNSSDLNQNLAVLLASQRRFEAAAERFRAAIRLAPDAAELRFNYASMLRDSGRADEAVAQSRAAVEMLPDDPTMHFGLALGLEQLRRDEEAMAAYERVLQLQPGHAAALYGIGAIHARRGETEAARIHFEAAVRAQPDFVRAYRGLAQLAQQAGRPDEALAHLERAAQAEPDSPDVHALLGDGLAQARRFDEAVASYRRAIELRPGDPELHARLGYVMMVLSRPGEAIAAWEEALRLRPDFPGLAERIAQARRAPPEGNP